MALASVMGTGTRLQHTLDELVEVDAAAAVGIELRHETPKLVLGQIDVEALENLFGVRYVTLEQERNACVCASSSSASSTLPLLSRSRSSNDLMSSG